MTNHLSSEQISRCVTGETTPEEKQHAQQCEECRTEVHRMQTLLSDFRGAVSHWAERQQSGVPTVGFSQRRQWRVWRWAPAAAAVAAVTVIPLYRSFQERERQAQAAQSAQDALLLERVNLQLSRTAPESLQPLVDLISDTTTEDNQGERR